MRITKLIIKSESVRSFLQSSSRTEAIPSEIASLYRYLAIRVMPGEF